MTTDHTHATKENLDAAWQRYGQALLHAMAEVRAETPEEVHAVLMETADYWLSLGLTIGKEQPEAAERLLRLIESEEPELVELRADGQHFVAEALG
jgi:plasmid stabilization system protein ParE